MRKMPKNIPKSEKSLFISFILFYPMHWGHFAPSRIALALMIRIWANMGHMAKWPQRTKNRQNSQKSSKNEIFHLFLFYSPYPMLWCHFAPSRTVLALMLRIWAHMGQYGQNGKMAPTEQKWAKHPTQGPKMNFLNFVLFYRPSFCF